MAVMVSDSLTCFKRSDNSFAVRVASSSTHQATSVGQGLPQERIVWYLKGSHTGRLMQGWGAVSLDDNCVVKRLVDDVAHTTLF